MKNITKCVRALSTMTAYACQDLGMHQSQSYLHRLLCKDTLALIL